MTMGQRDWTKYPWSFMSTRYGPVAEADMIAKYEGSGEFQLEQPNDTDLAGGRCPHCNSSWPALVLSGDRRQCQWCMEIWSLKP